LCLFTVQPEFKFAMPMTPFSGSLYTVEVIVPKNEYEKNTSVRTPDHLWIDCRLQALPVDVRWLGRSIKLLNDVLVTFLHFRFWKCPVRLVQRSEPAVRSVQLSPEGEAPRAAADHAPRRPRRQVPHQLPFRRQGRARCSLPRLQEQG
jgi:hypothetical protein